MPRRRDTCSLYPRPHDSPSTTLTLAILPLFCNLTTFNVNPATDIQLPGTERRNSKGQLSAPPCEDERMPTTYFPRAWELLLYLFSPSLWSLRWTPIDAHHQCRSTGASSIRSSSNSGKPFPIRLDPIRAITPQCPQHGTTNPAMKSSIKTNWAWSGHLRSNGIAM
ncbi:hypothetical protein BCR34DRAFT_227322 [Clohesyomyces aquaticus]|uniref:Uncharacterized protein n=1 Tax=Clohesyomyces aquaticus TaxID=1231657 RepID=A0A1Y1Y876_9PLEO|nr:hypothetical protein BCR34DRAFT_227322 [Clohesyomyces aquaticus]